MSNFDIIKMFEEIISEDNSRSEISLQKDTADKLKDYKAKSKKKSNINQDKNEDDDELKRSEEEKEKDIDSDDNDDDDDDVDSDEAPGTIHLEDALKYSKLKNVLNKFRASHSLKSPDISEELKDYHSRLSKNEKMALYVFIKGLVQITGDLEATGDNANIPNDFGIDVKKTSASSREKRLSKAKKVKSKEKDNMSPITVGESKQDKRKIYKILLENK